MNKVLAIILIFLGVMFIAASLGNLGLRASVGMPPEYAVVCFMAALGAVAIWGGIKFWRR